MNGVEPLVGGIGEEADGQEVNVPVTDPAHGLVAQVLHSADEMCDFPLDSGHVGRCHVEPRPGE